MDYSYILNSALPQKEKLLEYGFCAGEKVDGEVAKNPFDGEAEKNTFDGELFYKKDILDDKFYVLIKLIIGGKGHSEKGTGVKESLTAEVWEKATGEKYVLFDVASAQGSFIGQVRNEVREVIDEICARCFLYEDVHQKYVDFLAERFGAFGDNPWASEDGKAPEDEDYAVFRCPNKKWFALIMKISFRQLGFTEGVAAEEKVWVVNLKADPKMIPTIINKKSIFPAYHMNKKYWITILLTAVTDFTHLCELTEESFNLVASKK